jgi:hypothetical protein
MKTPRFLVCDPLPSQTTDDTPEYVLDTTHGILWEFDDEGKGSPAKFINPDAFHLEAPTAARLAREVGDWLATYRHEERMLLED